MNSVEIIGIVKEKIEDKYRKIEYPIPYPRGTSKDSQFINCIYWTSTSDNRLTTIVDGKRIALRGHLDAHEKFGTIIVVEQFEVLN